MPTTFKAVEYTEEEIENLEVEEMQFPYSDKRLKYDGLMHEYIPTEYAFLERGVDIRALLQKKGIENVDDFLKNKVAFKFYHYAETKCALSGSLKIKYLIARKGISRNFVNLYEYRNYLIETMVYLGEYLAVNGDLGDITGVDVQDGTSIDIVTLRGEERNYPEGFRNRMTKLGLNFVGDYKFNISGLGKDW